MKKKDVEKQLRYYGWRLLRHGKGHDIWTNGEINTCIPRHNEIKEMTAKGILKTAKENPPKEEYNGS